jgi:hypothetical protein
MLKSVFKSLFFFCILLSPIHSVHAGYFYAILVGDTLDEAIGESVQTDITTMQKFVKEVAEHTKMPMRLVSLTGPNAVSKYVKNVLTGIPFKSDDVVLFYYSGHGYRTYSKPDSFPYLYLGVEGKGVDVEEINALIRKKNPSFFVSMVDCCNSYLNWPPSVTHIKDVVKGNPEGFAKLFTGTHGFVLISSATPGEYSYCTPEGGFYTLSFLSAINREVQYGLGANWQSLLNQAQINLLDYTDKQHLIYKLDLY